MWNLILIFFFFLSYGLSHCTESYVLVYHIYLLYALRMIYNNVCIQSISNDQRTKVNFVKMRVKIQNNHLLEASFRLFSSIIQCIIYVPTHIMLWWRTKSNHFFPKTDWYQSGQQVLYSFSGLHGLNHFKFWILISIFSNKKIVRVVNNLFQRWASWRADPVCGSFQSERTNRIVYKWREK